MIGARRLSGLLVAAAVLGLATIFAAPADAARGPQIRQFTPRFQTKAHGEIVLIGNMNLTCATPNLDPIARQRCFDGRQRKGNYTSNNDLNMEYVNSYGSPMFSSSTADLNIPSGSTVLFAGLYWSGALEPCCGFFPKQPQDPSKYNQVNISLPRQTGIFRTLTADQADSGGLDKSYQGFKDVTSIVRDAGSGTYTVANIQTTPSRDRYAGWAMIVAYGNATEPMRSLNVYDGFLTVDGTLGATVKASGLVTPPAGPVRTRVGAVGYDGEMSRTGDRLQLNGTALSDAQNPADNFFNSTISNLGALVTSRNPSFANTYGLDVDRVQADNLIPNGATSATITMPRSSDTYYTGVITLSTELAVPDITAVKAGTDVNGGDLRPGDEIEYSVTLTNKGQDSSADTVLRDDIPAGVTYVPGSLRVDGTAKTDAAGDDNAEISGNTTIFRLGAGATATDGGRLAPNATTTVTFRVKVKDDVADGATIANVANVKYTGAQSGKPFAGTSNTATMIVSAPRSDLAITKTGSPAIVQQGTSATVTYALSVVNQGPKDEPAVKVSDTLPADVTLGTIVPSQGTCTGTSCDLGALAVGDTATVTITATVKDGADPQLIDTATVTGANIDPDGKNNTATATTNVNTEPQATDDITSTDTATPVVIDVLANDTDPDGDPLTVVATSDPAHGSVSVNRDNTVTYTPDAGFAGTDTFTYTISDGKGGTATATVTVTVRNAPPIARDDSAATGDATAVTIDVLANDTDPNDDPLTVTATTNPSQGTVVINKNNTVTYTPNVGFKGTDTFTYTISDGRGGTATATVTVQVANAAPVAVDDSATTTSGKPVTIDVLRNDYDPNGDPLTIVNVGTPGNGTAVITDNKIVYIPAKGFKGTDTFTYTISDVGADEVSTANVTVTVANAPPIAVDDRATTDTGTPVAVAVLANDSDPNGDALTIIGVGTPGNGTTTIDGDKIDYTPARGFKGTDTFTYTISDGDGGTATAKVTVTVRNAPPVATDDTRATLATTPVTIPVLANDSDPNGDPLTVTAVTQPANGSAIINADGTVTYTPDPAFVGTDTFTYTISDGDGGTATATVTVAVVNVPPIARDDSAVTGPDRPVSIDVLANDSDPNGDSLTITKVGPPAHGEAVIQRGAIVYAPDRGFKGTDTFTYTISDGRGGTASATVTVTVLNAPPVAVDDTASTSASTPVTIDVLANDSDPNGDPLTISRVGTPGNGTATIKGGKVVYTPKPGFKGTDTFTYTISDGDGGEATATVSVTVGNAPPTAADDRATAVAGTPVTIDVLANDSDPNGDPLTITTVSAPGHGTAVIKDGKVVYTPDPTFVGTDTFTYTIDDGDGGTATATVTVIVGSLADLAVTKRPSTKPIRPGETFDYTLTVTNNGPSDATKVVITDAMPRELRFVSSPDGCTASACPVIARMDPGDSRAFRIRVRLDPAYAGSGPGVVNRASVKGDGQDPDPANNDASAGLPPLLEPSADLVLRKTASRTSVRPGDRFSYVITVLNRGPSTAANVVITDVLSPSLTVVSAGRPRVPTLAPGATLTYRVTVRLSAGFRGDDLRNRASVSSDTADPSLGNNVAVARVSVREVLPLTGLSLVGITATALVVAGLMLLLLAGRLMRGRRHP